jgi:hypothetical protein
MHFISHLFAHFTVGIDLTGLGQCQLKILVLQFVIGDNRTVSPDFEVTFFRVDNYIVIFIRTEHFSDHVAE